MRNHDGLPRIGAMALATALLAGCTTFSADGGFGTVQRAVKERTGQEPEGTLALRVLLWVFVYLPLIGLALTAAALLVGSAVAVS